jgi:hypothetical protein
MMRKFLVLGAVLIAAAAVLLLTRHGREVLGLFGVEVTECDEARWLDMLGFDVPQCTCGNCSLPFAPQPPMPPSGRGGQ